VTVAVTVAVTGVVTGVGEFAKSVVTHGVVASLVAGCPFAIRLRDLSSSRAFILENLAFDLV
jgi:hypothetical protein